MRIYLWLYFLLLIFTVVFTTSAEPVQIQVNASHENPLLFLGNANIAPVMFLDGDTPQGVDVDIVRALTSHISHPIEIKAMNWSEAQSLVAQGKADALIQINPTEERLKIYDFSDSLLESQFSIFTRAETLGVSGISSLRGLNVGVEAKGLPIEILEKNPEIHLTIIPNFTEGFKQLHNGSLDAVVVDYWVGSYVLAQNNISNIKVSGEPIASSNSSFAVKKGNTKLLNEINSALQIIKADGTYQKILDTWKPTEVVFQTHEQITEDFYHIIIFFLLLLFLIVCIWIITIQKELARRKIAEKKLMEQYSTLRDIINSVNALIFSLDRNYLYTSFNQGHATAMKALYGVDIELGHCILDYISVPLDRETSRHNFDLALAGKELVKETYSGEELRSGKYFYVIHNPIWSGKEIIGVAVLAHDITDRKQAENKLRQVMENLEEEVNERTAQLSEANQELIIQIAEREQGEQELRESEKRYRDMFEINNAVMFIVDSETNRIIDVNAAAIRYYGYSRDELINMPISKINIADPDVIKNHISYAVGHKGTIFHFKHKKKSGEIRNVEVFSGPIIVKGKQLLHSIIQDVTERNRVEEALRQANHKLNLLSSITRHDIGNELQIIFGYLGLGAV
jgi:PAS domain S-box-containing protein